MLNHILLITLASLEISLWTLYGLFSLAVIKKVLQISPKITLPSLQGFAYCFALIFGLTQACTGFMIAAAMVELTLKL